MESRQKKSKQISATKKSKRIFASKAKVKMDLCNQGKKSQNGSMQPRQKQSTDLCNQGKIS